MDHLLGLAQPDLPMEEPLVPLAELPTHVLAHILELLGDVADLARAACVCKLWRDEVSKGMWHSVTALHLRKFHVGCAGVIKRAVDQCRNLREVDVSGCSALHAAALLPLAALPVQVLRLADLWELRASSLLEAICQRGTLRVLDLSGTSTALDMELVDALEPCANLQEFRISHARPGMLAHLTQNCTGLTSLDLSSCSGITDACLETAALDLSCLRYARFAGCTYICHAPAALGRYVSTLVYVDLSYTAVTDHCLAILVRSQPQLQTLLLSGCMWLEGHSLQELAASPCVQHGRLQRLRLSELPRMQDVCLRALLTALKDMFRAHDCPSGFSLDLSHCGGITDILLTSLVSHSGSQAATDQLPDAEPTATLDAGSDGNIDVTQQGQVEQWSSRCPAHHAVSDGHAEASAAAAEHSVDLRPVRFAELQLAGCNRLSCLSYSALAEHGMLSMVHELDLCHLEALRHGCGPAVLMQLIQAASGQLRVLKLDGAHTSDEVLFRLAGSCRKLRRLSLIGCSGFGDGSLSTVATACTVLDDLAVGGPSWSSQWHESIGLAAFRGLKSLRIARRSHLQDQHLISVLQNQPQLTSLALAGCYTISDKFLQALPQTLVHLSLSCCDRVTGRGLARLKSLETLRLSGCPAITPEAMQVAAASCASLRLLELPSTLSADCLPVQAPGTGHISGIRVEGGTPMSSGRFRTRLRSRTRQTMPP